MPKCLQYWCKVPWNCPQCLQYHPINKPDTGYLRPDIRSGPVSFLLCSDLSPEFLNGIDPEIIVSYFENASPADLKVSRSTYAW